MKLINNIIPAFLILILFLSCTDDKAKEIIEKEYYIRLTGESKSTIETSYNVEHFKLTYETNIEEDLYNNISVSVDGTNSRWCKVSLDKSKNVLSISVTYNENKDPRQALVTLKSADISLPIKVYQDKYISNDIEAQSKKIDIISASSPNYLDDNTTIEKAFDGDVTTYFNGKAGEADFPYELKFTVNSNEELSHLIYYPRMDNGTRWGQFGIFEVWYNTESNKEFVKLGKFDFKEEKDNPSTAWFESSMNSPKEILLKVYSGFNNRVSIGEIEFYAPSQKAFDYTSIFKDKACSELKESVTMKEIDAIPEVFYRDLAEKLFSGVYEKESRIRNYRPYQHPSYAAKEFKTNKYSLRDNPTGIFYNNFDDNLIVFVDDLKDQKISLNIVDFSESANEGVTYTLSEGLNVLKPSKKGLVYIFYHVADPLPLHPSSNIEKRELEEKSIKIHIATGAINGYFDVSKHSKTDWPTIRDKATSKEIDILGLHSHVVWSVSDYKEYDTDIKLMTDYIDNLIKQQHQFMGLYHFNRSFKNRQFMRIDYSVPAAYATDYRTVYKNTNYKEVFCSEDGFKRRLWVMAHEVGHTNQTRPGMKWHGTTEVTNNLYALYNQEQTLGEARRLSNGDGKLGFSNNDGYDAAFSNIIDAKEDWYLGGKSFSSNFIPRLTPLWQLYLYVVHIEKQEHFYHNIYEHYRISDDLTDDGLRQLDFVRNACNYSKINLLDFFEKWGFLTPIDIVINDYGNRNIRITKTQIDNLKNEIISKGYKKPSMDVHKLRDNNYRQYIK